MKNNRALEHNIKNLLPTSSEPFTQLFNEIATEVLSARNIYTTKLDLLPMVHKSAQKIIDVCKEELLPSFQPAWMHLVESIEMCTQFANRHVTN